MRCRRRQAAVPDVPAHGVASLNGYRLDVQRISHASERGCYVELSETFDIDGVPTEYPECLVFEANSDGLINRVSVFI